MRFSLSTFKPTIHSHSHHFSINFLRVNLTLLIVLCFNFLCPTVITPSSASDQTTPRNYYDASSISIGIETLPPIDITPSAKGSFQTASAQITIHNSSVTGYSLYLNTLNTTNELVSNNAQHVSSIPSLTTNTVADNFSNNQWGFTISDVTPNSDALYHPIPRTSTEIFQTSTPTPSTGNRHLLTISAKIDTTLPAGQYSNDLIISAIAHPNLITELQDLTYMQDMTTKICHDTLGSNGNLERNAQGSRIITPGYEVSKQLTDTRDGQEYWVTKLADGNCWMTQNLALDFKLGTTFTNANTDLNSRTNISVLSADQANAQGISSYLLPTEYAAPTRVNVDGLIANNNAAFYTTRSWNLGQYFVKDPDNITECTDGTTFANCPNFESVTATSDRHFLIGNYYQFNAATAGSGTRELSSPADARPADYINAPDSICPKGWRLPIAGEGWYTAQYFNNDEYYHLLHAYGYPAASDYLDVDSLSAAHLQTGVINNASQNPTKLPIALVRAGKLNITAGKVEYLNNVLQTWYSTTSPRDTLKLTNEPNVAIWSKIFSISAYQNQQYVYPGSNASRYYAYPIRCLAK